ncbi:M28 family metallopeptidase [Aquabacterium humicola]|uniref:M28 family metallopeptidase n=1 Tax=Aquabacterium humicola TaxID=3237377 RepID=UPI002543C602|nr:M28 family metallopeptidase [Rubrivivax pictus]
MKSCALACVISCALSTGALAAVGDADPATIKAHVEFLADDLMEGREAGTRGYDIAARYVASQFARIGLRPGGDAGTFLQRVPLRSTQLLPNTSEFEVAGPGQVGPYKFGEDFVVLPSRHADSTDASAEVVYAGHGIVAHHLGVDDYAGLDAKGKFVVVLAGSPPLLSGDQAAHFANPRLKQEFAAARGAVGVITLQTPANEALFPFAQIPRTLHLFRSFAWLDANGTPHGGGTAVPHLATLSIAGAEKFLGHAGLKLADLVARAGQGLPPRTVEMTAKVRIARKSRMQDVASANVVGVIEGSDALLKHEHIVVSAHLDHLGMVPGTTGDTIHNGALDNATGVAVITEAARLLAAMPSRPKRSIVFVALTGEEAGLLGSEHFVSRSHAAGTALVANLNVDMPILTYDFRDICAFGAEHSSIGELIARVAQSKGVQVSPDPKPERRRFTRSDQYSFVKAGIPAAFLNTGVHSMNEDGAGQRARDEIEARHYHRVSDDTSLPINYGAAARFAGLGAAILVELANAPTRPHWKPGNFFGETFGRGSGELAR